MLDEQSWTLLMLWKQGFFLLILNFSFAIAWELFQYLVICFRKSSSFSISLLYEKWIPKIVTVFNLKSIECQLSPFRCTNSSNFTIRFIRFQTREKWKYVKDFHNLYQRFFIFEKKMLRHQHMLCIKMHC